MLADIPGLIEGAHEGTGLGDRFLGHIERCGVLLHLVDASQEDVADAYKVVRAELEAYGGGLEDKPEIVALSKTDIVDADTLKAKAKALKKVAGREPLRLSAATGEGVDDALRVMWRTIEGTRHAEDDVSPVATPKDWTP